MQTRIYYSVSCVSLTCFIRCGMRAGSTAEHGVPSVNIYAVQGVHCRKCHALSENDSSVDSMCDDIATAVVKR